MSFILRLLNISNPYPQFHCTFLQTKPSFPRKNAHPVLSFSCIYVIFAAHKARNALYKLQCVFSGCFVTCCHGNQISVHITHMAYGLFTNILSARQVGNGRLFVRGQILVVNWGGIILSNNNNLLPTCKFYLHRNHSKSPIFYWITHVQYGLCETWSKILKTDFPVTLIIFLPPSNALVVVVFPALSNPRIARVTSLANRKVPKLADRP